MSKDSFKSSSLSGEVIYMDIAHQIYEKVQQLPESLAKEVLDFVGYIGVKHRMDVIGGNGLNKAQEQVMSHIWDNRDDEVWNDL